MVNKNVNLQKMNYGFSLLKMLLAFEVLLGHFANWDEYNPIIVWPFRELVSLAVPCFVILSFYLVGESFLCRDFEVFRRRFIKLLIPQVGWSILYYLIYQSLDILIHTSLTNGFSDFLWQLFTGHSRQLNASMWYQVDIIVVTILFYSIFELNKDNKKGFVCLTSVTILCYILQFSGVNRLLFGNLRFELKYPLGRLAETIPYAFIGFSIKYFNVFETLKKKRYVVMIMCVILFFIVYNIPWTILKDFGFSGFCKPCLALCIVTFAYLTPLEYSAIYIKKFILAITDYTLGIYCIHRLINTLLYIFVPHITLYSFERCLLLYVICYFTCFLIHQFPNKNVKRLVN